MQPFFSGRRAQESMLQKILDGHIGSHARLFACHDSKDCCRRCHEEKNAIPRRSAPSEKKEKAREWITKLPVLASHYCRKNSRRLYLPAEIGSFNNVYRKYKNDVEDALKEGLFFKLLSDYNIGIHRPRNDKCTVCEMSKRGERVEGLDQHEQEKSWTKAVSVSESQNEEGHVTVSFDLQKVLGTPHSDAMTTGFSRKFAVYNETLYEKGSRKGFCFLWNEGQAKRGANEVASVLEMYLINFLPPATRVVHFLCDSCGGQNRNRFLLWALTLLSARLQIKIEDLFLCPGHTEMAADSVHATIERFIQKRPAWAPSEWPTMIRSARVKPFPYEVVVMQQKDIHAWSKTCKFPQTTTRNEDKELVKWSQIRVFVADHGEAPYKNSQSTSSLEEHSFS